MGVSDLLEQAIAIKPAMKVKVTVFGYTLSIAKPLSLARAGSKWNRTTLARHLGPSCEQSKFNGTNMKNQIPRRVSHKKVRARPQAADGRKFDYELNYASLDLRKTPDLYRIGVGEQGVLLVEPYKSELLPHWKFKTPADARRSVAALKKQFRHYKKQKDLVGMDMARKFLQMGFTRARRYANHKSGRKYDAEGTVLPFEYDEEKAASAAVFKAAWEAVEADTLYARLRAEWKARLG